MGLDPRARVASTWAQEQREERDDRRAGHIGARHGIDQRNAHGAGTRGALAADDKHREIDRELRRIATHRAALDAEEARWLREAERHQVWRKLGFSTALEYLEDVFGYAPRTAMERLRVAKELGVLPQLEAALASGALSYSAAKELSRVMTPDTEAAWLAQARGRTLRDVEEMVAGRKKGDGPDAQPDPDLFVHEVRLRLTARTKALWEQMRAALQHECDGHLDDDQLVEVVTRRVLGHDETSARTSKTPKPAHRIVIHKCDDCGRAWQDGNGRRIQLRDQDLALAECDATIVRETSVPADANATRHDEQTHPTKTTSSIPAKTRKRVWERDQGRCRVPGCRATRHLDIHHIIPRAVGGTHDECSLLLLCSGHHQLHHAGLLSITGRAPDELVFIRDGKRLGDGRPDAKQPTRSAFADVVRLEQAKQALRQLGFTARAARAAIDEASAHVDADAEVAELVRAALAVSRPEKVSAKGEEETIRLATQALVQLGYPRPIASSAVAAAHAHVGAAGLETLIREALQRTREE